MEIMLWLLASYTVGTVAGWYMQSRKDAEDVAEAVIDSLIEQGYIKTKGSGENLQVLKWWEDDTSKDRV